MFITLRNGENILIESGNHTLKVISSYDGDLSYEEAGKEKVSIEDVLLEERLLKYLNEHTYSALSYNEKDKQDVIRTVERANGLIGGDKNKLFAVMLDDCHMNVFCYFTQILNRINDMQNLKKEISDLNSKLWTANKEHEKEIIELQNKLMEAQGISTDKVEVEGSVDTSYGIRVSCPYCNDYQEVDELGDWNPGEKFEGNQECKGCGKVFSVQAE